ncbi:hypothetical protein J6590_051256 [Homalodisca vitripennis]|nr:hypothetical protein J6590_051256 [Homalodisca vitripennis]
MELPGYEDVAAGMGSGSLDSDVQGECHLHRKHKQNHTKDQKTCQSEGIILHHPTLSPADDRAAATARITRSHLDHYSKKHLRARLLWWIDVDTRHFRFPNFRDQVTEQRCTATRTRDLLFNQTRE